MRIIALSLWERVAEGRVRAPQQPGGVPSLPFPTGCLHRIPSPQPSPKGRGGKRDANHSPSPSGRGWGEGRVRDATNNPRAFLPCRSRRAACTGYPHPNPLPEGEGVRGMRIIPLSLWERVAEGRVRDAPTTRRIPSLPFPTGCLHRTPSPQPSPRGRGGKRDANHSPLPLGEGGRRPGEGAPITRRIPSLPFPTGCLHWIPSPQPSPRGRGGKKDANHSPLPLGEGGRRPGPRAPQQPGAFLPCPLPLGEG